MSQLRIAFITCPDGHRQRVMVDAQFADWKQWPMRCNYPIQTEAAKVEQVTVRERYTEKGKEMERLVPTGVLRTTELAKFRPCGKVTEVEVTNEPVILEIGGAPHAANRLNEFEKPPTGVE